MVQILLKDVNMKVKNNKTIGEQFLTTKGIPQGDCLSPVLFTLYLAKALKDNIKINNDHNDHSYAVNDTIINKSCMNVEFNKYKYLLTTNKLEIKTRIRLFNVYIASIFLYNAELWYSSTKVDNIIDTLQRSFLRKMLKIRWPYKISNVDLYIRTSAIKWSTTIKTRRLRWIGHLMRLPDKTATKTALNECIGPAKKFKAGRKIPGWEQSLKTFMN